jgi:integrase
VANLKVSIIEKIKADGVWKAVPVSVPKEKPNGKGLYLKDHREGKFLLVWREGGQKRYSGYIPSLPEAIREKKQKELYLAGVANGLRVEDPTEGNARLTVDAAIDEFLSGLTGRGNTVPTYRQNLRQFQYWNSRIAKAGKTYLDQIDRQHMMAFKKYLESNPNIENDEYTAVWKCIRVNKMIKTMLKLPPGQGPVKKSDFSDVLNRKPVVTTYRKDERDKFLATCKGVQTIIWTLFLKCGLRLKELSYLEWTDIDFVRHIVRIRRKKVKNGNNVVDFIPKKWSIRDVAIPTDLLMLLEQQQAKSSSNLCFSTRTGRINTKLWDQCKRIAKKAGVDVAKFKPKNFRSSYATNRLRSGYTLPDIRDQMGHRDIHSVEHYLEAMRSEELVSSGRADAGWD